MTLAHVAAVALVLATCDADRTTPTGGNTPHDTAADGVSSPIAPGQPKPREVSSPVPRPTDAPHARACQAHSDCAVVPVLPADDGCCDFTVTAAPVTNAYLEFMTTWRRSNCSSFHVCAPNDLPGALMSPACYVGRCVAGMCDLGCNDPTFDSKTAP